MPRNPLPSNYHPRDYSDYGPEPLDLVGDAVLSIMSAAGKLVQNKPLYVGKHLMDAAYLFNTYLDRTGNDRIILGVINRLKNLALTENYDDQTEVLEDFLSIVEPLEFWAEKKPYLRRTRTLHFLDQTIRTLQGQLTKQEQLVTEIVENLEKNYFRRLDDQRRNPDDEFRDIERRAELGDRDAEAGLLARRLRAGQISVEQVRLAAQFGHPAARLVMPEEELLTATNSSQFRQILFRRLLSFDPVFTLRVLGDYVRSFMPEPSTANRMAKLTALLRSRAGLDAIIRRLPTLHEDRSPERDINTALSATRSLSWREGWEAISRFETASFGLMRAFEHIRHYGQNSSGTLVLNDSAIDRTIEVSSMIVPGSLQECENLALFIARRVIEIPSRRNPDERNRRAERSYRAEGFEGAVRFIQARLRSGELPLVRVELAAYLGHPVAQTIAKPFSSEPDSSESDDLSVVSRQSSLWPLYLRSKVSEPWKNEGLRIQILAAIIESGFPIFPVLAEIAERAVAQHIMPLLPNEIVFTDAIAATREWARDPLNANKNNAVTTMADRIIAARAGLSGRLRETRVDGQLQTAAMVTSGCVVSLVYAALEPYSIVDAGERTPFWEHQVCDDAVRATWYSTGQNNAAQDIEWKWQANLIAERLLGL